MIADAARRALEALLGERVRFDAPVGRHTSLGVGGAADAIATPESIAEVEALVALCAEQRIPLHVLGGGFNTLVRDAGVDGVVLRTQRLRQLEVDADSVLNAQAGVSHSQVTRLTLERGLAGLEFGAGIPGSVGGWVAMNAGIPGRETGDRVLEIEVATPRGGLQRIGRAGLRFVYRGVQGLPAGSVVVAARFQLEPSTREAVRAEVERHLAHRRDTQPIDQPSFGSVFKNPPGERAGQLIELAGLKGLRCGGAEISSVHANFIVNVGAARAADALELMRRAQAAVRAQRGIELEPEVRIVGRCEA
ncbi:MAG: UDP-N-acetylenolpyruvoylglucosamine reductase [Proteobacteria bacterium]|nr:MAG: UDP-N-acetylenolpyruvoylglucosamine reductase [Pseudomonadota bacterium]